jgi:uncharacterized protein (TIGR00369 family)
MIQNLVPKFTVADLDALMRATFPQAFHDGGPFEITEVFPSGAVLQLNPQESHLRYGGTVSGPTMFALADVAGYLAILAHVEGAAGTVTANMNINFLRKPDFASLYARSHLLRLGRLTAVTETSIYALSDDTLVAHATATYSIPPIKK